MRRSNLINQPNKTEIGKKQKLGQSHKVNEAIYKSLFRRLKIKIASSLPAVVMT